MTSLRDNSQIETAERIDTGRRGLFALAALPLLVVGLGSRALAAPAPQTDDQCATGLSAFQINQRKSLKYRPSADPQKKCGLCMYFSGATDGCGKCQLMLNGPVSSANVCDGFMKKPA